MAAGYVLQLTLAVVRLRTKDYHCRLRNKDYCLCFYSFGDLVTSFLTRNGKVRNHGTRGSS